MYEVKITVEIPDLPEAINALTSALKVQPVAALTQNGANNQQIENQQIENAGTVNINTAADAENTAPAQTETSAQDQATTAALTTTLATEEKSYTMADLSRAGATLIDQGKMPQLIELLKKYNVQAVTQLDASAYPAFVEEMKALGAQL